MLESIGSDAVNRSMGAVLADAYAGGEEQVRPESVFAIALERWGLAEKSVARNLAGRLPLKELQVDYGGLDVLRKQIMTDLNPVVLRSPSQRALFEDKLVLLGDAGESAGDRVQVRGRDYPGVLFHASAAYTLLTGPLYTLTTSGRLAIDAVCILGVLAVVTGMRLFYGRRPEHGTLAVDRLYAVFAMLLLLVPAVVGIVFVRTTRLLWSDFLLTGTALVLHPRLEHGLTRLGSRLKNAVGHLFRTVAFERKRAE
jgi:hypothetical protein